MHRHAFLVLASCLLAACATTATRPPSSDAIPAGMAGMAPPVIDVPERFVSGPSEGELDSVATWTAPDGGTRVIASAKGSHRLVLFDGDSGERLAETGARGAEPGRFNRPNGVAVHGDLLFVVERDNHRVQVLSLPDFRPLGTFGDSQLRSPYGLWIGARAPDELDVYVTDSFMYGERYDVVPPLHELARRVHRFDVQVGPDGGIRARHAAAFGDTSEAGALHVVESIAGDSANDRLLIADEDARRPSTLREYSLAGRPTGRSLPQDAFSAQAEGVALWTCGPDGGYWIAVDQLAPRTVFHLFDRTTLAPRGSFRGSTTARTDGVALHAAATPSFPGGVLYAVHDDRSLAAFDLRDVVRALSLDERCLH